MPDILTVEEVCNYLRISKPSLYRYVRAGTLPGFKMGKLWKFHRHSIDKWVKTKASEDAESRNKVGSKKKKTR